MQKSAVTEATPTSNSRLDGKQLRPVLLDLYAGLIVGVLAVTISTAFAALVFSGDLADSISKGIGLMLVASMVIGILTGHFSSLKGVVARLQDSAVAILAVVSAAIVSQMPASATLEQKFITVVVAIALSSLLTGALFLSLGQLRLGNLIRFIPYPVIGGFLAGSGLLLTFGAISVLVGVPVNASFLLYHMTQVGLWVKLLPGLLFAVLLLMIIRRQDHVLIIPGFLIAGIVGFYVFLDLTNTSIAMAVQHGWLLRIPTTNGGNLLQLPTLLLDLGMVNWSAIGQQAGSLVFVAIVSVIALLLNANGIELATGQDADLNQDLKAAGIANVVAGLMGGMVGYHSVSQSALIHKMGINSRSIGIVLAFVCGLVLLIGGQFLVYFPNLVLGGLLLFLGLSILATWVYDAWFKMSVQEYLVIITILIAISVVGILGGVGLGVVLGIILFIIDYSRINVVRHALTGNNFHSNVNRPHQHEELLRKEGGRLYVLELQGFIFFGTAQKLLDMIRDRIRNRDLPPLRFLLLDFRLVNGVDSTALLGFAKIRQLTQTDGITVVLTHLSPKLERQMMGVSTQQPEYLRTFPDLDHGVEWCESQLISGYENIDATAAPSTMMKQLEAALPHSASSVNLLGYFEERKAEKGGYIITQGNDPGGLYFIEKGQVTVELKDPDGNLTRLRTMQTGTVVGELGFYLDRKATASVVADEDCTFFYLSATKFKEMENDAPEIASAFHKFIIRMLSQRLIDNNATLQALTA